MDDDKICVPGCKISHDINCPLYSPEILDAKLFCPKCNLQHTDLGEWKTRPHHKHLCEYCGFIWRVEPYCCGV